MNDGKNNPKGPVAQLYTLSGNSIRNPSEGRLVDADDTNESDHIVIDFPNLPDEISLARDTEWKVSPSPLLPDGFHVYSHTTPLAIPLTFKVHAFDSYSARGPETILEIAAKLHALTLPIINGASSVRAASSAKNANGTSASAEGTQQNATGGEPEVLDSVRATDGQTYYFPPACVLNLMIGSGGPQALGIVCIGYVKSVDVRLKGPWLSSNNASANRNLPSAGEFSFTFIHAPAYTNSLDTLNSRGNVMLAQAGAKQVRGSFYNTMEIAGQLKSVGYRGLLSV